MFLCALLLSVAYQSRVFIFLNFTAAVSFQCMLSVSESNRSFQIFSSCSTITCWCVFHLILSRKVKNWYNFQVLYRVYAWFVFVLLVILGIARMTSNGSKSYALFQQSVIAFAVFLQLFLSHILVTVNPVEISVRISTNKPSMEQIQGNSTLHLPVTPRDDGDLTEHECTSSTRLQESGANGV
jgi:hypothetical protein